MCVIRMQRARGMRHAPCKSSARPLRYVAAAVNRTKEERKKAPKLSDPLKGRSSCLLLRERESGVYDTTVQCVGQLIMQCDAILQLSLHG